MAEVYSFLTDSAYASTEHPEHVNEPLRWLNRLEFKDWMPPALAFGVRFREKNMISSYTQHLVSVSFLSTVYHHGSDSGALH